MNDSSNIKKNFGRVVMELRIQKGLTQEQLAEYLNMSPHTITRIETGNTFVSCEAISQFCKFFNVAPSVLFTPKPQILYDEHINYKKKITELLSGFSADRLKEIYNILIIMNK